MPANGIDFSMTLPGGGPMNEVNGGSGTYIFSAMPGVKRVRSDYGLEEFRNVFVGKLAGSMRSAEGKTTRVWDLVNTKLFWGRHRVSALDYVIAEIREETYDFEGEYDRLAWNRVNTEARRQYGAGELFHSRFLSIDLASTRGGLPGHLSGGTLKGSKWQLVTDDHLSLVNTIAAKFNAARTVFSYATQNSSAYNMTEELDFAAGVGLIKWVQKLNGQETWGCQLVEQLSAQNKGNETFRVTPGPR